jgi:hypothetical protein
MSSLGDNNVCRILVVTPLTKTVTWQIQAMDGLHECGCKGNLL